jgi:hypothetical protein
VLTNSGVGLNEARDVVLRMLSTYPQQLESSVAEQVRPRRAGVEIAELQAEIARLRGLLQQHRIDPDENVS